MSAGDGRSLEELVELYGEAIKALPWKQGHPPGRPRIFAAFPVTLREAVALAAWYRSLDMEPPPKDQRNVKDPDPKIQEQDRLKPLKEPGKKIPMPATPKVEIDVNEDRTAISAEGQGLVKSLEDLVREANIDLTKFKVTSYQPNTWTTPMRDQKGRPRIVRSWQVKATLVPRLDAAENVGIQKRVAPQIGDAKNPNCTLIIPDSQHGYMWADDRRTLIPMHDELACDVVLTVARRLQPGRIILLGDMLDLAEWSTKFPRSHVHRDTTRPTLQRLHDWLADLREACASAEIVYLEGNHELRIKNALIQTGLPLEGLTVVGDDRPVLTIPNLLGLDGLDIRYIEPYGAAYWLNERTQACHGLKVRAKGGATAQAVLAESSHTKVFGHIHRVEIANKTIHGQDGARNITAASLGCLCRVDGAVPGYPGLPDWQQGFGVIWSFEDADYVEAYQIQEGRTVFNGQVIIGEDKGLDL